MRRSGHGYLMRFPEETWEDLQVLSSATATPVNQIVLKAVHSYMASNSGSPKLDTYANSAAGELRRSVKRIRQRQIEDL